MLKGPGDFSPPDPELTFCEQIKCPQLDYPIMACRKEWNPFDPWICIEDREAAAERQVELSRRTRK